MVWAIVVVAIAVLGVAAWAGTGRLGEMPETVSDRPKAHIPDGPVDASFLTALSIPTVSTGYRTSQVDAHLDAYVAGDAEPSAARFDVVRRGYDMQAVDAVLERMRITPVQAADGNSAAMTEDPSMGEALVERASESTKATGETPMTEPMSEGAEPAHHIVALDEESAPPTELAETPVRGLPAV